LLGDVKKQLAFIGEFFISIFELTLVILFIFCVSIFISLVFNFFLIFSLFLMFEDFVFSSPLFSLLTTIILSPFSLRFLF
jgi:hypothetical protein